MNIFCTILSDDQFKILHGWIIQTVKDELGWKELQVTNFCCGLWPTHLQHLIKWDYFKLLCFPLEKLSVPWHHGQTANCCPWHGSVQLPPIHWKPLNGELLSFIITSSAGVNIMQQLHPVVHSRTLCWIILTIYTLQTFTGCEQKSFILYGEDILGQMRAFTLKILLIWSISDFPGKRGFWVRSSPKMQPTDHMSTAVEYSCGEKNKHRGNPQKHRQSAWHASMLKSSVYEWMCSEGLLDCCRLAV